MSTVVLIYVNRKKVWTSAKKFEFFSGFRQFCKVLSLLTALVLG
jgi:hypothetical protein